ncbi:MAG: excinuclease ABC subunit UvrA [Candidatus Absconditabacterales bacterium]|nr:excinuclease ABC subunit UvrA [Candidatus Absconditabacterales bacterium]
MSKPVERPSLLSKKKPSSKQKKDPLGLLSSSVPSDHDIALTYDPNAIALRGCKTHNLKNIAVTLPKNSLITVTGVSGSGKSSFAFHTLYKEGQFRYIESLSSYLRQFFSLGARPDIEGSAGLSPAIAIEQNKNLGNSRSTVGTLTEIDDYLRLLYAKVGNSYSYVTGKAMQTQTIETIIAELFSRFGQSKIFLLKDSVTLSEPDHLTEFITKNRKKVDKGTGFTRYIITSQTQTMAPVEFFYLENPKIATDFYPLKLYAVYDRITVEETKHARLKEDVIKILAEEKKFGVWDEKDESGHIVRYTDKNYCPESNIEYPQFESVHFSFNRGEGACPECLGIGEILQVDMDKVIDPQASYTSAILPRRDSRYGQTILDKLAQKYSMDPTKKRSDLPAWFTNIVIEGDNELLRIGVAGKFVSMKYQGIAAILKEQYQQGMLTVDFQAMLEMKTCPTCHGARLRKESLHHFLVLEKEKIASTDPLRGLTHYHEPIVDQVNPDIFPVNIAELQTLTIDGLIALLHLIRDHYGATNMLIQRILTPLLDRAETIAELGLGYLSLNRQVSTLSGGEIQRLRLAKQLGNKLTGIIYVLDEPTIGLGEKEIAKAIVAIRRLQQLGNTIVVVEHNEEFIRASDWVLEIGPGAGDFGGHVIFNGPIDQFLVSDSLTAQYVTRKKTIHCRFDHTPRQDILTIKKASKHNLQDIDVDIHLGSFTIVTGHSGAGKTTLMYDTLFRFFDDKEKFIQSHIRIQLLKKGYTRQEIIAAPVMQQDEYLHYKNQALQAFYRDIGVDTIMGWEHVDHVQYVDQTSIGKTPRSCPSTFIGVFDTIRMLYAGAHEAKYLGFTSGHFSFNSEKGACPECKGYGYKKIELQFLPDTYVPCELCHGKRYKPEILDIKRRGKGINEVLDMYVSDALIFFGDIPTIAHDIQLMVDIGLGYLKMGQPAHTLSGGESQRLKLVKHLLKSFRGHTIYFLDEPTVGLHPHDIEKLLAVIKKFLDNGDTILMIEHDTDLLTHADHVIYLDHGRIEKVVRNTKKTW